DAEATWDKLAIAAGEVGETSVAEYISATVEIIQPSLRLRKAGGDQSKKINGKIASEVLSENITLIQESIKEFEVAKLAEKFMERHIITKDDMEAIVNRKSKKSSLMDKFQMLQLLQELKNTVSLKGEIFSWFIETLKECDTVESQKMARTLEEQYNKAKP
ncbi:PREDICTED: uncharacterized protein LOC109592777, partial [Amphimedon queenslandica]|uniref:Uncharacterized protein n=1 Tax=Amphimedon queenslandica TaxID=400682 RepID=A0AAN0K3F4_AMPQE